MVYSVVACVFALCISFGLRRFFACPHHLQHLPRIPVWPTLLSFLRGEPEADRIRRLVLPFADAHEHGLVLMWALGDWYIHILTPKLARRLMEDKSIRKMLPSEDMLLWKLIGKRNVILVNSPDWDRQAPAVRDVLRNNVPLPLFATLAQRVIDRIGNNKQVQWDELTHAFTLDAVGSAVMGHEFDAIRHPEGELVKSYRDVTDATAELLFVAFPRLERWFRSREILLKLDALVGRFLEIIDDKRQNPGDDFISALVRLGHLTPDEVKDNTIVMFMAGHDTTAGALSSLMFFLGQHPEIQARARSEALAVLKTVDDPCNLSMSDMQRMPFVTACVRESMRMNSPSTNTLPRVSSEVLQLGPYLIPPGTPTFVSMYAIGRSSQNWDAPEVFRPERFMNEVFANTTTFTGGSSQGLETWIPFSVGPRRCPAANFAMAEQRMLLAILLSQYTWMLPADSVHATADGIRNAPSAFALNLPKAVTLNFSPLSP